MVIKKLTFAVVSIYLLFLFIGAKTTSANQNSEKPNVIIFFTDDQGYGDLGCYGAKGFDTPNLDRMAEQGTRFTNFYVAASGCTPSRVALLTGLYPQRVGLPQVLDDRAKIGLSPGEITLANYLKQNGYATGIFGKWHLGSLPQFMPLQHGFDEFFGIPYSMDMWPFHPAPYLNYVYKALPLYENEKIIEYNPNNNMFTVWPKFETLLTMYADDYFNNNIWIWGDKPHWAYKKPEFMIRETNREAIEWTPNTIESQVSINGQTAHIQLISDTPNLKEYQMKELPSGDWGKVENSIDLNLSDNTHEFAFRVENLANVYGPEHNIKIQVE